jgi:hypothetical protein
MVKNKYNSLIIIIFISIALISLAIKSGDADGLVQFSDFIVAVNHSPIVSKYRSMSLLFSGLIAISICIFLFLCGLGGRVYLAPCLYVFSLAYGVLRESFESGAYIKAIQSIIFLVVFLVLSVKLLEADRLSTRRGSIVGAVTETAFCSLNFSAFIYLLSGYGYSDGAAAGRYFGLTDHPNFMAVISATAAGYVLSSYLIFKGCFLIKVVRSISFLMGVVVLFLTGSRTGLVILCNSVLFTVVYGLRIGIIGKGFFFTVCCILFISGIFYLYGGDEFWSSYDRLSGGEDTRSAVWMAMIQNFSDNALLGSGSSPNSENSFLKILGVSGVVGAWPFMVFVVLIVRRCFAIITDGIYLNKYAVPSASMILSLFVGAIFEGYLYEYAGFVPVLIILTSGLVLSASDVSEL